MRTGKKRYELLFYTFITLCCFIGLWIGLKLAGGPFPSGTSFIILTLVGVACGIGLPMLISLVRRRKSLPEMDERTVRIIKDYLLMASVGIGFVSGILLLVLVGIGYQTIELGILALYGSIMVLLTAAGLFVVKRL